MNVICNHCNKEFHIRPSFYNKNKTKIFYCCKQCMLAHKHVEIKTVKCNSCGKDIKRRITKIGKLNFCNQECRSKYKKEITLCCENCKNKFVLDYSYYNKQVKRGQTPKYCSIQCKISDKQKNKESVTCIVCNKNFLLNKDKISSNGNCCSLDCKNKLFEMNHRIEIKCNNCGNIFIKNKYRYENCNKHFCSQSCYDNFRNIKKEKYSNVSHFLRTSNQYKK